MEPKTITITQYQRTDSPYYLSESEIKELIIDEMRYKLNETIDNLKDEDIVRTVDLGGVIKYEINCIFS